MGKTDRQLQADRAVRPEPVGERGHQYLVVRVGQQRAQGGDGVVHTRGVHLAGAQGQLLDPGELLLGGALNAHHQAEGAQEVLARPGELLLGRLPLESGLVHLPAAARVHGHGGRAELRPGGEAGQLLRGVSADLRQ
ncbi:hypothetical protein GWI24_00490 [Streptomyces sp. MK37H]|nr:hypothetical protein [Streptomyces sp. MK37H]